MPLLYLRDRDVPDDAIIMMRVLASTLLSTSKLRVRRRPSPPHPRSRGRVRLRLPAPRNPHAGRRDNPHIRARPLIRWTTAGALRGRRIPPAPDREREADVIAPLVIDVDFNLVPDGVHTITTLNSASDPARVESASG